MELRRALVGVPEESRRAASVIGDLLRGRPKGEKKFERGLEDLHGEG